ncbi:Histone-lysine N-methyltransferase EHMT1 [Daphnia magna]|uniref:Histone-lysine N-methyltransferase EHMT1 n=1 Tax=Daphnia magna TaxID=35525 RepID=A0A164Y4N6_9CRUS|nr:Histone-lysine N-methyltransferase EHMT1 [Daphnia magna]
MDSLQEVSSTMAEDSEVFIEIEVSQTHNNGISLAEAANALITLQVPSKDPAPPMSISSSRSGENDSKITITEGNPKDVRKKILEGMKSQFNTNPEEEMAFEQANRRGPHRSKSKFKRQNFENEEDYVETVSKSETPKNSRGRGRPPRTTQIDKPQQIAIDVLKTEGELIRNELDSSSEAGSERSDSTTGVPGIITTRRSQRTNITRTSATDLLKGLSETRPIKKTISPPEPELVKPIDLPRKRGRPCKGAVPIEPKTENISVEVSEDTAVEDVSKMEHMASLGLQSKSSPDTAVHQSEVVSCLDGANLLCVESRPTCKKLRTEVLPTKNNSTAENETLHTSSGGDNSLSSDNLMRETSAKSIVSHTSLADESVLVANSLENEVELSIVEEQGKQVADCHTPLQVNGTASLLVEKTIFTCSCVESHPPVATAPPAATLYCQAVDSVGGKLVGCCLGTFLQCRALEGSIHFFHADCQRPGQRKTCLHCQRDSAVTEIRLQMKTCAVPVFCNDAKLLKTIPTAKISRLPSREISRIVSETSCPRYLSSQLVLPSGKVIDSNSIPPSLNKEMLQRILKSFETTGKSSSSNKSLYVAAKNGDIERVVECLTYGGHLALVHIILQSGAALDKLDRSQNTPLSLALIQGHNETVKYLAIAGSCTSLKGEGGMTALHLACKNGNLEACHYIMTLGNGRSFINAQDDGGWTPLVWGCEHQRVDIVKYLLQCKADPNVRDAEQNVALHWAAYSGSVDIVALLLDQGCDVNAANVHGDTPLHTASRRDNCECALLLITRGGRFDLRNKENQLALEVCPDKHCHSALLLALNMKLQQFTQTPCTESEKLLSNDITKGKEANPIQCVNGYDDEPKPQDFIYITENCFTSPLHVDRTINSLTSVAIARVSVFAADPPMLFECNRACQCHRGSCNNRLVQHGITSRLVLFRIENKGWGVRAAQPISKGSYVCEYIGEIITDFEADQREDDSYLFDLDNKDGETYCIDARRYGNIARFINHSCEPNLIPVKVYVDHQDLKFPRIAFFAVRDIDANEELAFDYGDKFWIIKYKSFTCSCHSPKCKYSQLTIHRTVEEYRRCLQLQELENGYQHS